jgi:SAM-dependent methyltransferase
LWNQLEWQIFYQPILRLSTKRIAKETGIRSGKVLDLGCGNGLRLFQFSKAGYEAEGLDLAPVNIRYAKDVLRLNVWEADVEESDLPASRYNLVMVYWVLEHLSKPGELVQKVSKSLKPGGWAILGVPLSDSWVSYLFRAFWGQIREAPRHMSIPSSSGMFQLLENNGFQNTKFRSVSTLELAGDVALTLWARGNFFMTTGRWAFLKILDRMVVGLLTVLAIPPVYFLKTIGIKQGLAVFFAQKKTNMWNKEKSESLRLREGPGSGMREGNKASENIAD